MDKMDVMDLPEVEEGKELKEILIDNNEIKMERIISNSHSDDKDVWYDQEEGEWVSIIKGSAILRFEDKTLCMKDGDKTFIPSHVRHRVEWTSAPCVWLAVYHK